MNMQKRTALLLAVLMLSGMLAACGEAEAPQTKPAETTAEPVTADETTEAVLSDGLPEADMDGFAFSVYNNSKEKMTWTNTTLDVEQMDGDVLNDAIYLRNRTMEERFNFVMKVKSEGNQISSSEIAAEVMAGDSSFDVWFPRDYHVPQSIPYLQPLENLPYIDLDAEWWFPQASEVFKFNGETYSATSYFSLSPISRAAGFVFNEDMYENIGAEKTPYEYVRSDTWTLETLYGVCRLGYADLNGNGETDDGDRFGLASSWKEIYARFINGSGIRFIEKHGDGYPEFTLPSNEGAVTKMMRIFELFNDSMVYRNKNTNMDTAPPQTIGDSTALFALGHPNNMGGTYRAVEMNVGFVPCPKYDENQERYYCTTWAGELLCILKTLPDDRLENVSVILEALSFDSAKEDGVMTIYKEVMMKGKYASNKNCEEMFDIVLDSLSFDFGIIAWEAQIVNPMIKSIYASGEGSVASTLASMTPSINGYIGELIENIEGNAA